MTSSRPGDAPNNNVSATEHERQPPNSPLRRLAHGISGSLSGTLIGTLVQPFDVIRTRMQADAIQGTFKGTLPTLKTVVKESGVIGLWRGTPATVLRLSIGAGTHFMLLDALKPLFESHSGNRLLGFGGAAMAGGTARAIATLILSPITLIKTRLEATGTFGLQGRNNIYTVARDIAQQQGIRGLWRGCVPALLSNAPFSAIYYSVYSSLRQVDATQWGIQQPATNFAAGVAAAMLATVATQPTDVLRARIHLGAAAGLLSAASSVQEGGSASRSMVAGVTPRFLKRSVQTALVWTLYEELLPVAQRALSGPARDPQR